MRLFLQFNHSREFARSGFFFFLVSRSRTVESELAIFFPFVRRSPHTHKRRNCARGRRRRRRSLRNTFSAAARVPTNPRPPTRAITRIYI